MFLNTPFFNPYYGQNFWEFLVEFIHRMEWLLTGQLNIQDLVSDELQVLVLMGVAISSALVGTFLILRRMTMLANSLSHTILMGIVLAFFLTSLSSHQEGAHSDHVAPLPIMLLAALLVGLLTTFLTQFLTKTGKLQEDASTGLVFTSLFALGIILVTVLTRDAHIGTEAVMGNADALHSSDLFWVYIIVLCNLFLFIFFFKEFKLTTFDTNLAYALGFSPAFFNYLLMAQVSATSITSFRAVGVLLVLAFMTGPPLAARLLTHHLKTMLIGAMGLGSLCALVGVALTRHILTIYGTALSTSGVVVCTILVMYVCIIIFSLNRDSWTKRKKNLYI